MENNTTNNDQNNQQHNEPQNQQHNEPQNQQHNEPQNQQYNGPQNQQYNGPQNQQYNGPQNQQYNGPQNQQYNGPQNQQYNGQYNQQYYGPQNQQYNGPQNQQYSPSYNAPSNPSHNLTNTATSNASEGKSGIKIILIVGVLLLAAALVYFFILNQSSPYDTVAGIEEALNELSMDKLSSYLDSDVKSFQSGLTSLVGSAASSYAGFDVGGVFKIVEGLGGIASKLGITPKHKLTVKEIYPKNYDNHEHCLVKIHHKISMKNSPIAASLGVNPDDAEQITILPMRKVKRKWLLSLKALAEFKEDELVDFSKDVTTDGGDIFNY